MTQNKIADLLSYARSQLHRERSINAAPPEYRDSIRTSYAYEKIRKGLLHREPCFSDELRQCLSAEVYGKLKALWDKGARGEVLWERIVAILTPLANEDGSAVNAPSVSESLLTTWKTITKVFNKGAELPLTVKQLKRLNGEQGGPIVVQKGRGKRPSVTKGALLAWRAEVFANAPLTRDDDGHAADSREVVFRREDQVGQTKRNMRSTGRTQECRRMP